MVKKKARDRIYRKSERSGSEAIPPKKSGLAIWPGAGNLAPDEIAEQRIAEWKIYQFGHDSIDMGGIWEIFESKTVVPDLSHISLKEFPQSIRALGFSLFLAAGQLKPLNHYCNGCSNTANKI